MQTHKHISFPALVSDLKECRRRKDLNWGKLLHSQARESGWQDNMFISTALITMYTKCRSMDNALQVFNTMPQRDTVTWTALIRGYVENGDSLTALSMFDRMDCPPDSVTFVAALKACATLASGNKLEKQACLQKGNAIHQKAKDQAFDTDIFVANTLIDMYSKCGSIQQAQHVFDGITLHRDVVSWSALIRGYVDNGEALLALKVFESMDCPPDDVTFAAALKACASLASENKLDRCSCLIRGTRIHRQAMELGFDRDLFVGNTLVDMYSKCGDMSRAREVLRRLHSPDVITWNALMLGYVENGESLIALDMFFTRIDCVPDRVTFVAAIKACGSLAAEGRLEKKFCLEKGMSLHRQVRERSLEREVTVGNTLVDMYSKCGDMPKARDVFTGIVHRSVVSWSALILGYVENGESMRGLEVFNCMDCPPDKITFLAAIKACGSLAGEKKVCLEKGLLIHARARESGFENDGFVTSALLDMYFKCGDMVRAREFFESSPHRDVVAWNVLILGCVENHQSQCALDLFSRMSCSPDKATFVAVIRACASLAAEKKLEKKRCLGDGMRIHRHARESGLDKEISVSNTLIDMYSKCGSMHLAKEVFEGMIRRDVVSWSALIHGYVDNDESSVALELFNCMDCAPNSITFVAALKACAHLGAHDMGQRIHYQLQELGLEDDPMLSSCLVDFYAKCGKMGAAEEIFSRMRRQDIVSWCALIGGYSLLGNTSKVFDLVKRMEEAGIQPDGVTMLLILTACSHAGLVAEGRRYFSSMVTYGITPTVEHCTCMVEMLGRDNKLDDALSLVRGMSSEALDGQVWMALLEGCRKWSNLEIGQVAFRELVKINEEKHVGAAYVLIRNIYESLGMSVHLQTLYNNASRKTNSSSRE